MAYSCMQRSPDNWALARSTLAGIAAPLAKNQNGNHTPQEQPSSRKGPRVLDGLLYHHTGLVHVLVRNLDTLGSLPSGPRGARETPGGLAGVRAGTLREVEVHPGHPAGQRPQAMGLSGQRPPRLKALDKNLFRIDVKCLCGESARWVVQSGLNSFI